MRGVAREAAIAYGVPFDDPARHVAAPPVGGGLSGARSTTRPAAARSRPSACTGVDPTAPTPPWLARRVQLAGIRPISLAVDVTNYVMLELGQPMHAYDGDRLAGRDRRPAGHRRARRLTTLDGVDARRSTPRTCSSPTTRARSGWPA